MTELVEKILRAKQDRESHPKRRGDQHVKRNREVGGQGTNDGYEQPAGIIKRKARRLSGDGLSVRIAVADCGYDARAARRAGALAATARGAAFATLARGATAG